MRVLLKQTNAIPTLRRFGRVARTEGLLVNMTGAGAISLTREVKLSNGSGKKISSEVAGFRNGLRRLGRLRNLNGICRDARTNLLPAAPIRCRFLALFETGPGHGRRGYRIDFTAAFLTQKKDERESLPDGVWRSWRS